MENYSVIVITIISNEESSYVPEESKYFIMMVIKEELNNVDLLHTKKLRDKFSSSAIERATRKPKKPSRTSNHTTLQSLIGSTRDQAVEVAMQQHTGDFNRK
eukprot:gene11606-15502_t